MSKRFWVAVPVAMLLAVTAARAGTVDQLRTTLSNMQATGPVSAVVEASSKASQGDKDKPEVTHAHARFRLHVDDSGRLHVVYPAKLLKRVDAEAATHAKKPGAKQPVKALLGSLGPVRLKSLVDFAPVLLHHLEGATLQSKQASTYDGKSATLLVFKVPPGMSAKQRKDLDHYSGQLKVWLDADGVPVAASEARSYKISKFFVLHIDANMSTAVALQRVGHRLVASTFRRKTSGSMMGHEGNNVTHIKLTVTGTGSHPETSPAHHTSGKKPATSG